jgi:hypothetical protein
LTGSALLLIQIPNFLGKKGSSFATKGVLFLPFYLHLADAMPWQSQKSTDYANAKVYFLTASPEPLYA